MAATQPSARPGEPAPPRPGPHETWKNLVGYAAAAVATVAVVTVALQLWRADPRVPLWYGGDCLMGQMFVQDVLESGWVYDNGRLGAPGAMDLRDFPIPDVLHVAWLKGLGWAFRDSGVVLNLYCLLPFPLTALSAYFVLRRLKLGRLAALAGAVLYSCAPYHFFRAGGGHLFLAAYYLVPLLVWLALRVYVGRNPFHRPDPGADRPRWRLLTWEAAGAAVLCVLAGLAGAYYAFFACFLLLAAGAAAAVRERRWAALAASALPALLIAGALAAALAPSLLYRARHGRNYEVAARCAAEADLFGLNVSEMLLPVYQHRIQYLDRLRERFVAPPRHPTGEAAAVSLGGAASLGFLWLVGRFVWRRGDRRERTEDGLAYLTVACVVLGTVGGLGSQIAYHLSSMIRCYNRLSIFIAFCALAAVFLLVQRLAGRFVKGPWSGAAYAAGLAALLGLGLFDQSSTFVTPRYALTRMEYASDEDFGRRMEAALPPGALVYQMPYVLFPEYPAVVNLGPYELLRPWLHTHTLHFSYGAVRGREAALWHADLAARPLSEVVEKIAFAGFRGVYLDRAGFADGGQKEEQELSRLLGVQPLVSLTGRQSFFDMSAYIETLRGRFSDEEWQQEKDAALRPVQARPSPEKGTLKAG